MTVVYSITKSLNKCNNTLFGVILHCTIYLNFVGVIVWIKLI